ncbi:MAG: TlyA family RNA methyltransferase [Nitrospirota bacterium]|nr:TlyA family RNA methyltransferase [Nitrospirota bacterium]
MCATPQKPAKERLDTLLLRKGLAKSREQAGRYILAGLVRVNGDLVDKRGKVVEVEARIDLLQPSSAFVSRGGDKLAAALDAFSIEVQGLMAMDVGASTGGFTDCLLQRGVVRVYAVDVGYGQLDWKIRNDPRVVVLERSNIRYVDPSVIPDPIELLVIDVSFISLELVIPCIVKFLSSAAKVIALVKPQFEVGVDQVGRGGIVRDDSLRHAVKQKILILAERFGLFEIGTMDSPVLGRKGNREILVALEKRKT